MRHLMLVLLTTWLFLSTTWAGGSHTTPNIASLGIVNVQTINAKIIVENAYFADWNFIGRQIEGYHKNICYLTLKAANALSEVQKELEQKNFGLMIFDCYRPQRAVKHFVAWAKDAQDTKMQTRFYPDEPKKSLISRGYISSKSTHSRGSTVDLTLIQKDKFKLDVFKEKMKTLQDCRKPSSLTDAGLIDMGTTFDCFSALAATDNPETPHEAKNNRQILKLAMEKQGFKNYSKEWWHFTLSNETYTDTYFDFEVQ